MHGPLGEAVVEYGPSKVRMLRAGSFVRCAVSGQAIALEAEERARTTDPGAPGP
jgi:hypothetical protein